MPADRDQNLRRGAVVAAFPAVGKSYVAERRSDVVDSDSSSFSWKWFGPDVRERHPEWPGNYIEHIKDEVKKGNTVLVSTHAEVRAALHQNAIPFTLVYPVPMAREEYRDRMYRRESPVWLIEKVIDELWTSALHECAAQLGCVHVVLRPSEYLSDVMPRA